ncbi:MAG: hypothetical protein EXR77_06420 [Myxococcales bacterium]|nr:hypothetical protein [Myxococcales bacterium]
MQINQTILCACLAITLLAGSGCETLDKARMKVLGVTVDKPEPETAEWVIHQVLLAAKDPDEERGWEKFQKLLHSQERSTNALKGWQQFGWPRIRRQANLYLDEHDRYILRDFKTMQNDGIDFFLENRQRDLPTPCAVYLDFANNKHWRIKRCSL